MTKEKIPWNHNMIAQTIHNDNISWEAMRSEKIHLNDPKMMTATCGYGLLRKGEIISFRDVFLHKYTNPMWLILDTYTHN